MEINYIFSDENDSNNNMEKMLNELKQNIHLFSFSILKLNLDSEKCLKADENCQPWSVLKQILEVMCLILLFFYIKI